MTLTPIPEDYTVRKDRFLYTLVGPDGKDILSGLTEEACRQCLYCLPEFYAVPTKSWERIMDLLEDIEDTKLAIERKDSIPMPITLEELAEL